MIFTLLKNMNKKILIPSIIVGLLLVGGITYLYISLDSQKKENKAMQELAEMDKKEMENEYQQFANQYSEMKTQVTNDSIVAQLTAEQNKTQKLLNELRNVKSSDAHEIARLKKELATVRKVLRSYVMEIDSLNRLNQNLTAENTHIKGQYAEATRQIEGLNTERQSLSEKITIAAQLDAVGINMTAKNKRGRDEKKIAKAKSLQLSFSIAKNVTAASGSKTIYARITSPTGSVLYGAGNFNYENKSLQSSMQKTIEYGGQETPVTLYWNVTQALVSGTYRVSIFCDGNMIGNRSFTFK